jgi:DNA-binding NarL/FixJ family response regulator
MYNPKIIIADDHKIVADGLVALLSENFEIVAVVNDGIALIDAARQLQPDVIITDVVMPHLTGLDVLHQIKEERLRCKVVMLTMHSEPQMIRLALQQGAAGYILKDCAGEELIVAINEVSKGHIYISPAIVENLISIMNESRKDGVVQLTPRQRQVMRLVSEGHSMKEIGAILKISSRTVETYKYEMMRTLGVTTTADLIRYAVENS